MIAAVNRLLAPMRRRLENLVARGLVQLVDDSMKLQTLQLAILEGETRDGCERFQQYGFTSVPQPGAEAVVLFVGGLRDHPLVLAVDDRRSRKKNLQPGESALYSDEGDYIWLKRGRILELLAGTKVSVSAPFLDLVTGVLKVAGTQVVGARQSAITAPTGGSTIDSQARTAINDIRAALTAHGLTA